ncbi:MAG TPA: LysR family transcriptional regulator [Gemmataceae bacterium]|nr:LysR family transcriptional regulator [Gemmataceae bacterium]
MQFESLKVFCDVARYRSFSQAAAANSVSQSAASQVVSQLEKRMGVLLINRSTRPLQLTPLGKAYYDGCQGLVEQYLELEASVRNAESQLAASVQVAAIYSVGLGDISRYVERFITQQPHAKVHIEYLHPDRVIEKVLDGTADFGLVSFPRKTRELTALPWRDERMVLACAPAHALAAQRVIRPAQLAGEKYIAFDKGLVIRREVDRFLRDQEVSVEVVLEFDNIENIKKAIEISAGVALLPEPTLHPEVANGTLVARPLDGCRFERPLGIIHRRHHKLGTAALRFIDLLRQPHGPGSSRHPKLGIFASGTGPLPRANGAQRGRNGTARASKRTV